MIYIFRAFSFGWWCGGNTTLRLNPFVLSAVCSGKRSKAHSTLSLSPLSSVKKKSRASSRFQQMHLLLATSFHHRAVVCFSTVSLAFPRDDDDERREMMAPRRRKKERKKEASESFFFLFFGREKKRKRRKKFWCQDFFFLILWNFFRWGGLWSVFFFKWRREKSFLLFYSSFL